MPVGDVNDQSRGSGARFNDGKLDLTLLPTDYWFKLADAQERRGYFHERARNELGHIEDFWLGDDDALQFAIDELTAGEVMEAAKVFEYGAKKYATWNWAKGMPWSVAVGCYLRHQLLYGALDSLDEESGCQHRGHAVCNLIMLKHFLEHCPDLDDRPVELRPEWHAEQAKLAARESAEELGADLPEPPPGTPIFKFKIMEPPLIGDPTVPWDQSSEVFIQYRTVDGRFGMARPEDVPTPLLNELGEIVAEEQEVRERCLRTTGILR